MTYPENKNQPLKIALGTDNFKEMVTQYDVYVDKTLFIKEVLDSSEKAMLITYPRRWGKTLNLDMLKTFLEPENKECKKPLYLTMCAAKRYTFLPKKKDPEGILRAKFKSLMLLVFLTFQAGPNPTHCRSY